jgi:tRNA-splicing ligase RtcB (3'-phosphate/5'-hydroxy nucleic acid ligase)
MQPKNLKRLLQALARQGLDVSYNNKTYSIRLSNTPDAPVAEVLLPQGFPVEAKAFKQLANLANVRHPTGGCVCRACATPDLPLVQLSKQSVKSFPVLSVQI